MATHVFTIRSGISSGGYDALPAAEARNLVEDGECAALAVARNASDASFFNSRIGNIGQYSGGANESALQSVHRGYFYFKIVTSMTGKTIEAANIKFSVLSKSLTDGDFDVVLQQPSSSAIPHQPPINSDYNKANVSGNGGSVNTSTMTAGQQAQIDFNEDGISWIPKEVDDIVTFGIRSSDDIDEVCPDGFSRISIYNGMTATVSKRPIFTISITVTIPTATTQAATDIDTTIATLNGTITDIGHWLLSYGFELKEGLEGEVYSTTAGGSTQDITTFNKIVYGLTPGTTYYVRAWGYNEAGKGHGDWVKFTTESAISVTTESAEVPVPTANPAYCEWATGNGTITSGTNATERGFEIKLSFSGDLYDRIQHGMAGFTGDTSLNITVWEGTLTR